MGEWNGTMMSSSRHNMSARGVPSGKGFPVLVVPVFFSVSVNYR